MIHPDTELRSSRPEIGYGVFATRRIPKGTITWVQDPLDRVFSPFEAASLTEPFRDLLEQYAFRDRRGNFILCWDHARYVNHSFHSNCLSTAYDFELAVRDIEEGEELTDDYGYLNLSSSFEPLPEGRTRRRRVEPDDLLRHYRGWDRRLRSAFAEMLHVEQPLARYIPTESMETARAVAEGRRRMVSIRQLYFDPGKQETKAENDPKAFPPSS